MASLIPGFEYDIFISYRQKDNKYDGWVTEFVEYLKRELGATLKDEVSVYFDINPRDGLLETYDVDASLKEKLKCLIFIPVISRTYCDPKSFAWEHEFKAFVNLASADTIGLRVALPNGNFASRVLPVRIHEPGISDIRLCESILGGTLRGVDFIYKSAGVNRPLRINEDHPHDNLNRIYYRDQINKLANTIDEIISGIKNKLSKSDPAWSFMEFPAQNINKFDFTDEYSKKGSILHQFATTIRKLRMNLSKREGKGNVHKKTRNYIIPIIITVLLLIIIFGRLDKMKIFNKGNSNRELARSHVAAAVKYIDSNDYQSAEAELEIALDKDPEYSYAWSSLAALSYKQGDLNKAVLQTIKAIETDSGNSQAAYNLAFALEDKKDYLQAIHWYRQAIRIDSICKRDSVYIPACSALGRLYNSLNQPIDAILILQRAHKSYPESQYNYLIYKNLGNGFLLQEQTDSALKYLLLSREIKPQEPETNLFLARAYEEAGIMSKSIDALQTYIELETDTGKIKSARDHLKEITIKHLQDLIK